MIADHAAGGLAQIGAYVDALLLQCRLHQFQRLAEGHAHVEGMLGAAPEMRQRAEPIDDTLHALDLASDHASELAHDFGSLERRGSSWVNVLIATSGFLISWAMPEASTSK